MSFNYLQDEQMQESFLEAFMMFMPNDVDIYAEQFLKAVKEAEENKEIDLESLKDPNDMKEFIETFAKEVKDLEKEITTQDFIEAIKKETEVIQNNIELDEIEKEQTKEIAIKNTNELINSNEEVLEVEVLDEQQLELFNKKVDDRIGKFILENTNELKQIPHVTQTIENENNKLVSVEENMILSNKERNEMKEEYTQLNDNKKIQWQPSEKYFSLELVKERSNEYDRMLLTYQKEKGLENENITNNKTNAKDLQNDTNDFIQTLKDETNELLNDKNEKTKSASLEDETKELNPKTYYTDLIDWFDKKKQENENTPMTKEEFKKDFISYCKGNEKMGMSQNEMKILIMLANKEPNSLSLEHKKMIKEGLENCLMNDKLIDKDIRTAIQITLKDEKIKNNDITDMCKNIGKLKNSDLLVDKQFIGKKNMNSLLQKAGENTKITPENKKLLNETVKQIMGKENKKQKEDNSIKHNI